MTATRPSTTAPVADASDDRRLITPRRRRPDQALRQRIAVDRLSFAVPAGSVAGLIGPNGAGKTTIMAMLLGLVRPTSGTGTVLGSPVDQAAPLPRSSRRAHRGPGVPPRRSGFDNLRSLAVLGGHRRTASTSSRPRRPHRARRRPRRLVLVRHEAASRHRRRAARRPGLVILDEPTNGLDPVGMQDMRTPDQRDRPTAGARSSCRRTCSASSSTSATGCSSSTTAGSSTSAPPSRSAAPATRSCCAPTTPTARRPRRIAGSAGLRSTRRRRPAGRRSPATSTPTVSPRRSTGGPTRPGSSSASCTTTAPSSKPATSNLVNNTTIQGGPVMIEPVPLRVDPAQPHAAVGRHRRYTVVFTVSPRRWRSPRPKPFLQAPTPASPSKPCSAPAGRRRR